MNLINNLSPLTALHLAAQAGSSGCVSALLTGGADPNLVDNQQQTPLFPAVEGGHSKCIEAVSESQSSVYYKTQSTSNK